MIPWMAAKDDHDIGCKVTARGDERAIVPPEIERVPQVLIFLFDLFLV
jgi:hypothetical protein